MNINPTPSTTTIEMIASNFAMNVRQFKDGAKQFPELADNSAEAIAKIETAVRDLGIEETYQIKLSLWIQ